MDASGALLNRDSLESVIHLFPGPWGGGFCWLDINDCSKLGKLPYKKIWPISSTICFKMQRVLHYLMPSKEKGAAYKREMAMQQFKSAFVEH